MSNPFVPIIPADLQWHHETPYLRLDDSIYPMEEGIQKSRYVFIEGNNLIKRWGLLSENQFPTFSIAETNFGSGLNFLLTWHLWEQYAPKTARLHFFTCAKHPLKLEDLTRSLNRWPELAEKTQALIKQYPVLTPGYHYLLFANNRISLTLMLGNTSDCLEQLLICGDSQIEQSLRSSFIDTWYLNEFTWSNPIWNESLIKVISMLSSTSTTVAAYNATNTVISYFQKYGFIIDKQTNHNSTQIRMVASVEKTVFHRLRSRHTPWQVDRPSPIINKSVIIIGGGLAGCCTAHALAKKGWQITLIDELEGVGKSGSANKQAVLFPKLSAYKSPFTELMLTSFLYAHRFYQEFLDQSKLGALNGSILLAYNEKEKKAQQSLKKWLQFYPELGELVDEKRASELSGLFLNQTGVFTSLSGWINSPALCEKLIKNKSIRLITNSSVNNLIYKDGHWIVNDFRAPVLILANSFKINEFYQTKNFPIKAICGQMTSILPTSESNLLKIPLSAEGHILPPNQGSHSIGATYKLGITRAHLCEEDDTKNIHNLKQMLPQIDWSEVKTDHWAGIRAATPDYLPLVGPIPKAEEFITLFTGLASDSKRWIPHAGGYYPGLYACAGFGSRGLTTIPLCAEWLASLINNEIGCLPRNLITAIAPARFLRRMIIQGTLPAIGC